MNSLVDGPVGPEVRRPGPLRWLGYTFGAGLPPRHQAWVLRDTTCPTWALRHVARCLIQVSPLIVAVLLLVPGPIWIRSMCCVGGVIMSLIYALGLMAETTEHRVTKAGYPVGTAEGIRAARQRGRRSAAVARRREKMFDRLDRRGHRS